MMSVPSVAKDRLVRARAREVDLIHVQRASARAARDDRYRFELIPIGTSRTMSEYATRGAILPLGPLSSVTSL